MSHHSGAARPGRRLAAGLAVAVTALGLAGCGSSSDGGGGGGGGGQQSLTVVTPNLEPDAVTQLYLAKELGYFDEFDVKVNRIDGVAAGALPLLASGKADLIIQGTTSGFQLVEKGVQTNVIWSGSGGGTLGSIAVKADSPFKSIDDLSGKKVGTVGTTGSQFGYANLYRNQVQKDGRAPFTIVPLADPATMINSVQSGSVQAANGSPAMFQKAVAAGKLRLIASTADKAQRQALLGGDYSADTGMTGIASKLGQKKEAVVRFLQAIDKANDYLVGHTPQEVADVLAKDPFFKALTPQLMLAKITLAQPFRTPYNGRISEDVWKTSRSVFDRWDLPTLSDVTSPKFDYGTAVNMSYLDEARQRNGN